MHIKDIVANSAREKAKQYAATKVRKPNRSIELAERIQERKEESLERDEEQSKNLFDVKNIQKQVENYKRLFNL